MTEAALSPPPPTPPTPRRRGLSALAVRRPIGTLMLSATVIVLGLVFLLRLPVDLLPSITYPRIAVRVDAPGVSPEVVVEEITRPLEQALAATEGVVQIFSQTREGRASVDLYFRAGGDVDQALNDATAAVNRARGSLPPTIEQPRISKIDPSQQPIIEFALTSPGLSGRALRIYADEELARELATVEGVAGVDVSGGAVEEVQVLIDLQRLQSYGLGLTEVLAALSAENRDVSGGRLEGERTEALVRTVGRFREAAEIARVPFLVPERRADAAASAGASSSAATPAAGSTGAPQTRRVLLGDFAEVVDGTEDARVFVTLNGEPAVKVSVQKQPEANTVDVVDGVKARVEALRKSGQLPQDAVLNATLDESVFISRSIRDVALSGLAGAMLAGAVILLFLGSLRQTFIVILAIPLGTLVSVMLLALSGASLNIFTLGGLAVGIGAVDSCIVVLENIVRAIEERRRARNPAEGDGGSADEGETLPHDELVPLTEQQSTELESALLASTTTGLMAVVPFFLIGGFIALLFHELFLTVVFTMGASLLMALTVIPALSARLLSIRRTSGIGRWKLVKRFSVFVERLNARYKVRLGQVLQRPGRVIVFVFLGLGALSALLWPFLSTEILPSVGTGQARMWVQLPPGLPLSESRRLMKQVDALLLEQKETRYAFTTVGGFLFGNTTSENPLRSSVTVTLEPGTDVDAFVSRMNARLAELNLVNIRLRLAPERIRGLITSNSPVRADVDVVLQGVDPKVLEEAGRRVLAALDAQAQKARYSPDADPVQPEIQVRRDPSRAGLLGLTSGEIGEAIQTALEGTIPTQLQRGERLVDVRVKLARTELRTRSQLEQIPLVFSGQAPVRLSDVATLHEGVTPGEIQRINQRQVFIIEGDLAEDASLGEALEERERILSGIELPEGVTVLESAAAESDAELRGSLLLLGAIAVFLVFTVMAVQYDSLVDPLVILFTVPLALVGALAGLVLTGVSLGITALIGAVLLVGVIVGNGIILVEYANQMREETPGLTRAEAMFRAAPIRLRPILITTLLATLGVAPLALGFGEGTELLRPLAIVTFFGLSLGTLLTLFVVPCFYVVLHSFRWRPSLPPG